MQREETVRPAETVKTMHDPHGDVLLDVEQGVCYGMNEAATRIWNSLRSGESMDSIAAGIARDFQIAQEQARADVVEFMSTLRARGLLDSTDAGFREGRHRRSSLLKRLRAQLENRLRRTG